MSTKERAHKIRLNPTPEQEPYFRQAAGNARFTWNWAVNILRQARKEQTTKRKNGKWRKDGKRVGFPKFKSRKRGYGSFYLSNDTFTVQGHGIRIPKLGWVNMTEPLRFDGKIMSARISERAGYWFVSIQVRIPDEARYAPDRVLGIDIGVKSLAGDSDGEVFENQKHLGKAQKTLRRLSRWLARKRKSSQNWHKARRKLARLHLRIANLRADAIHKMTTRLAAKARVIALETLNVIGMLQNHKLARAMADAAFA